MILIPIVYHHQKRLNHLNVLVLRTEKLLRDTRNIDILNFEEIKFKSTKSKSGLQNDFDITEISNKPILISRNATVFNLNW